MQEHEAALTTPPAGLPAERLNREHHGLRIVETKPKANIQLGWEVAEDAISTRRGLRMYKPEETADKDALYRQMTGGLDPLLKYNRKKQPDIPEKTRQRLYGIPGRNIFNYDVEIRKECKTPAPNLDQCMIPKEDAKVMDTNIPRMSIAMRSSLEESLLPKEQCILRQNSKQVSSKTYESHIEPGYVTTEPPIKTARLSPFRYTTNLEAGLVPASDEPWRARRHFSEANTHCYDCTSPDQNQH
ncbi:hypothetical protein, conserved [Babesia bigemina]|uniref:Uncharacterized protein n=1 Tax=Babesia bigemina TaxID=5866 RepID=A0A061D597_BABBI|nr:hypothetical protein, conserved [Babesia bigemina]CDR95856.1 hypothetical protein, conserved [Babesia bigemina]|eukprot:XP_012768042.1 hypothetical protein, conserved [Babesia bigemina]